MTFEEYEKLDALAKMKTRLATMHAIAAVPGVSVLAPAETEDKVEVGSVDATTFSTIAMRRVQRPEESREVMINAHVSTSRDSAMLEVAKRTKLSVRSVSAVIEAYEKVAGHKMN